MGKRAIKVEIATPEKVVFSGNAFSVSAPTPLGEISVLSDHIDFLGVISPGALVIAGADGEEVFALTGGVIEVSGGGSVRVLADTAERPDEIILEQVEAARRRAEDARKKALTSGAAPLEAQRTLEKELARLRVAKMRRRRSAALKSAPREP